MNALVAHLGGEGIPAVWLGSYGDPKRPDTVVVSPPPSEARPDAPALARRVYADMVRVRRRDGYGDRARLCFVHVVDAHSDRELAADRMGQVRWAGSEKPSVRTGR